MSAFSILMAKPEELDDAALLASHAMIDLPENVAVFRGNRQRMEHVFRIVFHRRPGRVFLAKDGMEIVGMMRIAEWPYCYPSPLLKLKLLPSMLLAMRDTMPRALKLQGVWARRDPKEHHVHFGPIAVKKESQRRGIGTALMKHLTEYADDIKENVYLETGTKRNVLFYSHFGFEIIDEASVLAATTWFMWRAKNHPHIKKE